MGKKSKLCSITLILMVASLLLTGAKPVYSQPPTRTIDPIVSTDWLYNNLNLTNLVILDVRSPDAYVLGHIEGSINVPSYMWYINPPFGPDLPWMELPPDDYLFELIGNASITGDSLVVVVGSTSGPFYPVPLALYGIADATRVAMTLLYAGIINVAILDGGYDIWANEGKPTSTVTVTPIAVTYTGEVDETMFVSKDYVASKIGKSVIVDARDPDVYFGVTQEPWCARVGHISTARNLPTPWLWNLNLDATGTSVINATYKDVDTLSAMAYDVVGTEMSREILVYCGVGGYASTMYFVLNEVIGYTDVRIYDGSAQEWTSDPQAPVEVSWAFIKEYEELVPQYNELLNNYTELQSDYDGLQSDYDELQSEHDELTKTTTPAYLTYIFIATTIVFVLISIYLALKRKKES